MQQTVLNTALMRRVAVIVPARNEEQAIPHVLRDLPRGVLSIVVDNGSTDATGRVAARGGALVVHEARAGYGAACLAGVNYLNQLWGKDPSTPRVVVFLDADYSDHPEYLPRLVAPIFAGLADFVLGSRLLGKREPGAMPPQSIYGNKLACFLIRRLWHQRYSDLGPFRAIGYDALRALRMQDRGFGWTIEMQIKAAVAGLRTLEIPVPYRRRIGQSKISGTVRGTCKAAAKILYTIGKHACTHSAWKSSASISHAEPPKGERGSLVPDQAYRLANETAAARTHPPH